MLLAPYKNAELVTNSKKFFFLLNFEKYLFKLYLTSNEVNSSNHFYFFRFIKVPVFIRKNLKNPTFYGNFKKIQKLYIK